MRRDAGTAVAARLTPTGHSASSSIRWFARLAANLLAVAVRERVEHRAVADLGDQFVQLPDAVTSCYLHHRRRLAWAFCSNVAAPCCLATLMAARNDACAL